MNGQHVEEAFLAAFEEHSGPLFRHALFRVSDREKAYDLVQDTFLKAWDYVSSGKEVRQYKSFLYRILHNLIIDEYRRKRPHSLDEMLENEVTSAITEAKMAQGSLKETEEALDERALIAKLQACIGQLPEHYRVALTLRFVDGLSTGEIAHTVGVSENVVSVRIHRGIAKLRTIAIV